MSETECSTLGDKTDLMILGFVDVCGYLTEAATHERSSTMTAIENLRATKMLLEHQLKEGPSAEEREWIEGELKKVDMALSLLNDVAGHSNSNQG